jgi:flagellar FliL protein
MLKLLPILLALLGTGAGIGAGLLLKPEPAAQEDPEKEAETVKTEEKVEEEEASGTREYVKLNNQFVVPVVGPERVNALVVLSLSIEVDSGQSQIVYSQEPKLRDVFLQVLFDHANIGGFDGSFTKASRMDILRNALREAAKSVLGQEVKDVLITEIARQDS